MELIKAIIKFTKKDGKEQTTYETHYIGEVDFQQYRTYYMEELSDVQFYKNYEFLKQKGCEYIDYLHSCGDIDNILDAEVIQAGVEEINTYGFIKDITEEINATIAKNQY